MEETFICIEDDDFSSNSAYDSDVIDSETEAELYSTIHYEENLNSLNSKSVNLKNAEQFAPNNNSTTTFPPTNNIVCTKKSRENSPTQLKVKSIVENQIDYLEENELSPDQNRLLSIFEKCLNPAKKHKSDSAQKSPSANLCPNVSEATNLNESSQNKALINMQSDTTGHTVKNSLKRKLTTTIIDSSDSDNDIWTEVDSSEKSEFQTNLSKDGDTIYLSSSDSESRGSSSFMKRESVLKNLSMPNIKVGEKYKEGPWHINSEDLYRQNKYSRRYHSDVTCSNCSEKGHNFRSCPVPKIIKCFICGGAHLGSRCANRICSNCFAFGHDRKRCRMGPNFYFCEICGMRGHTKEDCPDLWRRYHLTTEPIKIVQGKQVKPDKNMFCWNCGGFGHFGGVCPAGNFKNSLSTWPCVISYDDPKELLRHRLDGINARRGNFRWDAYFNHRSIFSNQRNQSNIAENLIRKRKNRARKVKRKEKANMQLKEIPKVVRERNFPRTPKNKIPKQSDADLIRQLKSQRKDISHRIKDERKQLLKEFQSNKLSNSDFKKSSAALTKKRNAQYKALNLKIRYEVRKVHMNALP